MRIVVQVRGAVYLLWHRVAREHLLVRVLCSHDWSVVERLAQVCTSILKESAPQVAMQTTRARDLRSLRWGHLETWPRGSLELTSRCRRRVPSSSFFGIDLKAFRAFMHALSSRSSPAS
eukprot:4811532-Amphidinium_carterae.1